jgi:hypothetical protein
MNQFDDCGDPIEGSTNITSHGLERWYRFKIEKMGWMLINNSPSKIDDMKRYYCGLKKLHKTILKSEVVNPKEKQIMTNNVSDLMMVVKKYINYKLNQPETKSISEATETATATAAKKTSRLSNIMMTDNNNDVDVDSTTSVSIPLSSKSEKPEKPEKNIGLSPKFTSSANVVMPSQFSALLATKGKAEQTADSINLSELSEMSSRPSRYTSRTSKASSAPFASKALSASSAPQAPQAVPKVQTPVASSASSMVN